MSEPLHQPIYHHQRSTCVKCGCSSLVEFPVVCKMCEGDTFEPTPAQNLANAIDQFPYDAECNRIELLLKQMARFLLSRRP